MLHAIRKQKSQESLEFCLSSGFQPLVTFQADDFKTLQRGIRQAWFDVRHLQNQQVEAISSDYPIRRQKLREQLASVTELELWVFCPERYGWFNVGDPDEIIHVYCPFAVKRQKSPEFFMLWQRAQTTYQKMNRAEWATTLPQDLALPHSHRA